MKRFTFVFLIIFSSTFLITAVQAASVELVRIGLVGAMSPAGIVQANLSTKELLLVGTTAGVYIISSENGTLENYIYTSSPITDIAVIDDITADGQKDMVLSTAEKYFPNIECYDSKTGDKIWSFSTMQEVYDVDVLWTFQQTPTYNLETIDDVNDDGHKDVISASGYRIYMLDGKTGKEIWNFESSNNLWEITVVNDVDGDGIKDVMTGGQNGHLYLLSGNDGRIVWDRLLADNYEVTDPSTGTVIGTMERSVWDIVPLDVGGKEKVVVSAEDGNVYLIDVKTNEIEWKTPVINYVDAYLYEYYSDLAPTGLTEYNFFNLRAMLVDDVTGDGIQDIVTTSFSGRRAGREYSDATTELNLLNSGTGEIVWTNQNVVLKYITEPEALQIGMRYSLVVPTGKTGSVEKIKAINIWNGLIHTTINVNSSSQTGAEESNQYYTKAVGKDKFLLVSNTGDLFLATAKGEVIWNYPRLTDVIDKKGDFTGDSTIDLLIKSRDNARVNDESDEGQTRIMFVIDGSTKEIKWSYEMPYKTFVDSGGLDGIKVTPDLNGDGKVDIAAFIQYSNDEFGNKTRIMVFSGKDGLVLMDKPIVNKTFYNKVYEDIYNNVSSVDAELRKALNLPASGDIPAEMKEEFDRQVTEKQRELAERLLRDFQIRRTIVSVDIIQDQSGDGIDDFIIGSNADVFILDSKTGNAIWNRTYRPWNYDNIFMGETPTSFAWKWLNNDNYRYLALDDLNGDKMEDLAIVDYNNIIIAVSNSTGKKLDFKTFKTITTDWGLDKDSVNVVDDFNNDGIREIAFVKNVKDAPQIYEIISPDTGIIRLEVEKDPTTLDMAVTDFDDDGCNDSIVFYRWSDVGSKIDIMTGKNEIMWRYTDYEDAWMLQNTFGYSMLHPAAKINDLSGDGIDDIVIVKTEPWQPGADLTVYDVARNKVLKSIVIEAVDETRNQPKRWQPAIGVTVLPDLNNDGSKEIGFIGALGESNRKEIKVVIVDIKKGEIMSDFSVRGSDIIEFGGHLAVIGQSGDIYFLDAKNDLSMSLPKDGETAESPLKAEWKKEGEAISLIMVDNKKVFKTTEKNASFEISKGNHTITVYAADRYGKGLYDTVRIDVIKESKYGSFLMAITSMLFFVSVCYPLAIAIKKLVVRK